MNEAFAGLVALAAGAGLGVIFFGGLWWTIRRGVSSRQPELWFFLSPLVRISIVLAGFYFVAGGNWLRLLLCLTGFVAARVIVALFTRTIQGSASRTTEASHAS